MCLSSGCLYYILWHLIQYFSRHLTQNSKCEPHAGTVRNVIGLPNELGCIVWETLISVMIFYPIITEIFRFDQSGRRCLPYSHVACMSKMQNISPNWGCYNIYSRLSLLSVLFCTNETQYQSCSVH